jgi:phenylalanyl-tRNA synthetase beta chain
MIVTDEVESQASVNVMLSTGVPLLESVQLFDVYTGAPIPEGHKNLAYSLTFRAEGRTLTTEEVEETLRRIKEALREKVSAQIRE